MSCKLWTFNIIGWFPINSSLTRNSSSDRGQIPKVTFRESSFEKTLIEGFPQKLSIFGQEKESERARRTLVLECGENVMKTNDKTILKKARGTRRTPLTARQRNTSIPSELQIKRILVPTDFSPESLKALRYAIGFAAKLEATLELLHVVETGSFIAGVDQNVLSLSDQDVAQKAHKQLVQWAAKEVPRGIPVFPRVRIGHGYKEIAAHARSFEADLIIISTHGYTGLKHALLGSTTELLVRHAPCPVLVVRTKERDFVSN
jgi:universal stress protein A